VQKRIHVIHNFVDTRRFAPGKPVSHRQHFARPDEKIVLHVSNFRAVKNLDVVVGAFARASAHVPSRLILIGDGPERERTLELARKLGVMDRTWYLGRQNLIENYYAIADALLFPSEYESFGVAALEAMSCAVPVVASQGSGLSEVVVDGVTGFLRPAEDVEAMGDALRTLLSDSDLARQMGETGRQRATCCFQSNTIMRNYLNLYEDLLEGRAPREPKPCQWMVPGKP
jgi:N-acetyl-alpha-D-glucosaminyl L-malate synthase BshA